MLVMQTAILVFVLVAGTAVVFTRNPSSQTIGISFYGILLALMFFIYQAPDVALSQLVIGAVALPLMILLALAKVRSEQRRRKARADSSFRDLSAGIGGGVPVGAEGLARIRPLSRSLRRCHKPGFRL